MIDRAKIARGLGATAITLLELTREESTQYNILGSPVMIPDGQDYLGDKAGIYYFGSQMLARHGKSLEDVMGYRILGVDEEGEFRRECGDVSAMIVCYYGMKN